MKRNSRGFKTGSFKDLYGSECSIQESSLATKEAIWLGLDKGLHVKDHEQKTVCCARMHVDKKLARKLIKHLTKFVETGSL